jgi:O-antigen/teichoic acid export membrane protein
MFLGQADKFIMYHFFGPVSLASYWIASTIPQEVGRVINASLQVAYPKFVKGNHEEVKPVLIKKIITLTWVLVGISCLYSIFAFPFFHIFFPQYVDQVWKSIVLMFGFAVVPHVFVWQYFTAKRNIKVVYINNTVDPILQVVLYIALVPFFGIWGFVYATVLKTVLMNILAWYVLKKY